MDAQSSTPNTDMTTRELMEDLKNLIIGELNPLAIKIVNQFSGKVFTQEDIIKTINEEMLMNNPTPEYNILPATELDVVTTESTPVENKSPKKSTRKKSAKMIFQTSNREMIDKGYNEIKSATPNMKRPEFVQKLYDALSPEQRADYEKQSNACSPPI